MAVAEQPENPWATRPHIPGQGTVSTQPAAPAAVASGPASPQPRAVPQPRGGLHGRWITAGESGAAGWLLGCHGGAGVSTLAATYRQFALRDASRVWPMATPGAAPAAVVLVARTHHHGLSAAQTAAQQWAAGAVPGVRVAGLVLVADAPGKLPKPLNEFALLVAGGVPQCWRLGWIDDLRFGGVPQPDHPAVRELTAQLPAVLTPNGVTTT